MSAPRHFLDLDTLDTATLRGILDRAEALKKGGDRRRAPPLRGKVLEMIFERPSTRTRTSFEVAMIQLGGQAITLNAAESQLGRGESVADTARVLSAYVDAIVLRARRHETLLDLAAHAAVPVINGLTDHSHPCQLMADVLTVEERRGPVADQVVAWSGDGNNVATSWIHAATRLGFELRLACPTPLAPDPDLIDWAREEGGAVMLTEDPFEAVADADCVVTDTWVSMGDDPGERLALMAPYRVDSRLMGAAKADALFLHCLPAHRGEEVTCEVIDGPRSAVWDEAGNRLHAQKAILLWCLGA
jgi:ornithine carbamoyltransferase